MSQLRRKLAPMLPLTALAIFAFAVPVMSQTMEAPKKDAPAMEAPKPAEPAKTTNTATMPAAKTLADDVMASKDLTTLLAAIKAAGLEEALKGKGPLTLFAPTIAAFGTLPAGTVENLMKPDSKVKLMSILNNHIVAEKLTVADLESKLKAGDGKITLKTLAGDSLIITKDKDIWSIANSAGTKATLTPSKVSSSNGDLFIIDKVLLPK